MKDSDCTVFLQWALPRLDLRWPGFCKVRRQVCKRIKRRMRDLGIEGFAGYRERLEADAEEWRLLDECCHITISRFFRDKGVFEALQSRVLPEIAKRAERERRKARCWSAGCASGEEPYSVGVLWDLEIAMAFPSVDMAIVATDVDETALERAREGCYEPTSLREVPPVLVAQAFDFIGGWLCVRAQHRKQVGFLRQDLRSQAPPGPFDLALCRNVAFTYFTEPLQRLALGRIRDELLPGGYLVVGAHEHLPEEIGGFVPIADEPQILRLGAVPDRQGKDERSGTGLARTAPTRGELNLLAATADDCAGFAG
jgi:chemotaxis protein methyltransferase CheR